MKKIIQLLTEQGFYLVMNSKDKNVGTGLQAITTQLKKAGLIMKYDLQTL